MKKQLFFGVALIAAISADAQSKKNAAPGSMVNMAEKLASKYEIIRNANEASAAMGQQQAGPSVQSGESKAATTVNWNKISGSMNIYGMLEISGRPLQYNDELNAISFIHRKSFTYLSSPVATSSNAASGVIVGMVTTDCGSNWDSTCIWNNNTHFARYPQGAIYNPPGNTSLANSYIVATGPVTSAADSWVGSYLASKKLDAAGGAGFNNVASTVANAQQFIANTPPFGPTEKFDYPSYSFAATDDGIMRTLGIVVNDFNAVGAGRQYRGARIVKGTFNSGVFVWTSDSIIVAPDVVTTSGGSKQLFGEPHMAWNESGTVGYVVHFGCRLGTTDEQSGFQPIIYKTTNSGASWNLLAPINFTTPAFKAQILDHIQPVITNSNLAIPLFNLTEGVDCIVDKNNHLHIISTIIGTRSSDPDSLGFIYNFNNGGEKYNFAHVPGARPYIYDINESSAGWNVHMVDSMSSEAPGERSTDDGYGDNPWDPVGGTSQTDKVSSCARIQASRTPDGNYLVYTWAESDTNFTNSAKKWNAIPNIKARAYDVTNGQMSNSEINLTSNTTIISTRAQMHHTSPKCSFVAKTGGTSYTVSLKVPVTVSTNQNTPLTQLLPNDHWFSCAGLDFVFVTNAIAGNSPGWLEGASLYPNPAAHSTMLQMELNNASKVRVDLMNVLGQRVKTMIYEGDAGENNLAIDLDGLDKGIYLLNINANGASGAKRLIVE